MVDTGAIFHLGGPLWPGGESARGGHRAPAGNYLDDIVEVYLRDNVELSEQLAFLLVGQLNKFA
jgi:hypothetical protein